VHISHLILKFINRKEEKSSVDWKLRGKRSQIWLKLPQSVSCSVTKRVKVKGKLSQENRYKKVPECVLFFFLLLVTFYRIQFEYIGALT
jgi:hypothetical protein